MSVINTIKTKTAPPAFATPENLDQAMRLAELMAKSDLVPSDYKGKPGNCLIAMQMGAELGLPPMQALQNIAVVNGRPAVWGDAVIGLVQGSGECEYIKEEIIEDDKGQAVAAVCTAKRKGRPEQTRTFTVEDAKTAGLWGRNTWKQYPKRMLQMRARSWAIRDVFADVLKGLHIAEGAMDIPTEREVNPEPVETGHQSTTEKIKAKLKQTQLPTLAQVIDKIEAATTLAELEAASAEAANLSEEDKKYARTTYKDRLEEINGRQ